MVFVNLKYTGVSNVFLTSSFVLISLQSLKERSVPPPVEDGNLPPAQYSLESYIHQEPLSPSESYPIPDRGLHDADRTSFGYNYGSLSVDEKKEFLVVARNSLDLLSSILNIETEPKPIKVILSFLTSHSPLSVSSALTMVL